MTLGERIRSIRLSAGLSTGQLAERTGLSKGLISQVETNKTSPSITTLEKMAEGLGVPAAYLLLKADQCIQVIRPAERLLYRFGPDQLKVEVLSGRGNWRLKAVLVEMPPGTSTGSDLHAHSGEEFHLLLEGRVEATQGGKTIVLEAGDALHWNGFIPHRVVNIGPGTAKALAVTSASVMEILGEEPEAQ